MKINQNVAGRRLESRQTPTHIHSGEGEYVSMAWGFPQMSVQRAFGMKVINLKPQRLMEGHAVFGVKEVKEMARKEHDQEDVPQAF